MRSDTYIPVLRQPCSLLRVPCQRSAPIAKQTKVDLSSHIERHYIQQFLPGSIGYPSHLFMESWPLLLCLLLERCCVLQDFWPCLLAVLQEQPSIELFAPINLHFGRYTMLVTDLVEQSMSIFQPRSSSATMTSCFAYLVRCAFTFNKQHHAGIDLRIFQRGMFPPKSHLRYH